MYEHLVFRWIGAYLKGDGYDITILELLTSLRRIK